MAMTKVKSQITEDVSVNFPDYSKSKVQQGVDTIVDLFVKAILNERRIEVRNFASFSTKRTVLDEARNPKTGEKIKVGQRIRVRFKAGKTLKEAVNNKENRQT